MIRPSSPGMYATWAMPVERDQVVLAAAEERDVPDHDHLVVVRPRTSRSGARPGPRAAPRRSPRTWRRPGPACGGARPGRGPHRWPRGSRGRPARCWGLSTGGSGPTGRDGVQRDSDRSRVPPVRGPGPVGPVHGCVWSLAATALGRVVPRPRSSASTVIRRRAPGGRRRPRASRAPSGPRPGRRAPRRFSTRIVAGDLVGGIDQHPDLVVDARRDHPRSSPASR